MAAQEPQWKLQAAAEQQGEAEQQQSALQAQQAAAAKAQQDIAAQQATQMQQQAQAFDPNAYAKMVGQQAAQQQASAARGAGASAGKAARLGNVGIGQTMTGAFGQGQQLGQQMRESAMGSRLGLSGQQQQGALGYGGIAAERARTKAGLQSEEVKAQQATQDWWKPASQAAAAGLQAVGSFFAKPTSDINAKEKVSPAGDLGATLDKIRALKYEYKPGMGTAGEKIGVAAQDLEKTPLASMVETGADGVKRLNAGELTGANTAMIAELKKYIDERLGEKK